MAVHEFGIMQQPPRPGKRYDEYQPQKYRCISVADDAVEAIDPLLTPIDFYWHTLDVPAKGLAYTGITLIPPRSVPAFLDAIRDLTGLEPLKELLEQALAGNNWVIHFGL